MVLAFFVYTIRPVHNLFIKLLGLSLISPINPAMVAGMDNKTTKKRKKHAPVNILPKGMRIKGLTKQEMPKKGKFSEWVQDILKGDTSNH